MQKLLIFTLVGFFAQLIDGSLGMAFGATSSSLLLMFGVAPAVVSATIHISEVATTAASGVSHWKFGNVDKSLMVRLAIPGAITAFIGAALLSNIHGEMIKPFISIFLLAMGIYILYRFLFKMDVNQQGGRQKISSVFLLPLAAISGFLDSIGGGGWGPINTPLLLSKKGINPRVVIGTVSTSEFAITLSASIGFLLFLGWEAINWLWVGAFALGGVFAAPIAAWLVKVLPLHLLGAIVGGLIILTNTNILLQYFVSNETMTHIVFFCLFIGWISLIIYAKYRNGKHGEERKEQEVSLMEK
ncbi:sulfite exporter TauE/SafE family protein [Oceanobacillus senegalensis]|uniref:sulfite exporter TauE/SafE family protein n=1 Tax=Oceanobacillus senegalensis TaxID=1936063 RepID=UPI000A30EB4D|nr:sulfite exporter TauE/SafE family protein [Oceanobacillus senegalensis]